MIIYFLLSSPTQSLTPLTQHYYVLYYVSLRVNRQCDLHGNQAANQLVNLPDNPHRILLFNRAFNRVFNLHSNQRCNPANNLYQFLHGSLRNNRPVNLHECHLANQHDNHRHSQSIDRRSNQRVNQHDSRHDNRHHNLLGSPQCSLLVILPHSQPGQHLLLFRFSLSPILFLFYSPTLLTFISSFLAVNDVYLII